MVIRQLEEQQFKQLYQSLLERAHQEPLEACFTAKLAVEDVEYDVQIQPEDNNTMVVLQAYRIDRWEDHIDFELVVEDQMLGALLEMMLYQGLR